MIQNMDGLSCLYPFNLHIIVMLLESKCLGTSQIVLRTFVKVMSITVILNWSTLNNFENG